MGLVLQFISKTKENSPFSIDAADFSFTAILIHTHGVDVEVNCIRAYHTNVYQLHQSTLL